MITREELDRSLRLVDIRELVPHERILPELEEAIYRQLTKDGFLAWPVVADPASGLILDGTHRYAAVRYRLEGRRILVQLAGFWDRRIRLLTWWRVIAGVGARQFAKIEKKYDLVAAHLAPRRWPKGKTKFIYGAKAYSFTGRQEGCKEFFRLAELEHEMATNFGLRPGFYTEQDAALFAGRPRTLVIGPPALKKTDLVKGMGRTSLPPKSTRFIFPYRILGPKVPLEWLCKPGEVARFNEKLGQLKKQPVRYLGRGLTIDRVYLERIYSYQDCILGREFFLSDKDHRIYLERLEDSGTIHGEPFLIRGVKNG